MFSQYLFVNKWKDLFCSQFAVFLNWKKPDLTITNERKKKKCFPYFTFPNKTFQSQPKNVRIFNFQIFKFDFQKVEMCSFGSSQFDIFAKVSDKSKS
jgi:hypothetical protein